MDCNNGFSYIGNLIKSLSPWNNPGDPGDQSATDILFWKDNSFYVYTISNSFRYLSPYSQHNPYAIAKQMTKLSHESVIELDRIAERLINQKITKEQIPKLISMLIRLEKTALYFSRGILMLQGGKLNTSEADSLEEGRDQLYTNINSKINSISKLILDTHISIFIKSEGKTLDNPISYSTCALLHKQDSGNYTKQLKLTKNMRFDISLGKSYDLSVLQDYLSGKSKITVSNFLEFKSFADSSPFDLLKKEWMDFLEHKTIVLLSREGITESAEEFSLLAQSATDNAFKEEFDHCIANYIKRLDSQTEINKTNWIALIKVSDKYALPALNQACKSFDEAKYFQPEINNHAST